MDVRNISDIAPVAEHNGTTPVWYMFPPGTMRDITKGGSLELINEFEIIGGGAVDPHTHPTHEFYYVLYGKCPRETSCTSRPTRFTAWWHRARTPQSAASASPSRSRVRETSTTQSTSHYGTPRPGGRTTAHRMA
jgi:hypothetical protein